MEKVVPTLEQFRRNSLIIIERRECFADVDVDGSVVEEGEKRGDELRIPQLGNGANCIGA